MDRIQIRGGAQLNGVIPISGAKNAALPLMIASLLTDQTLTLENLPRLADVSQLARILGNHGVDYSIDGKRAREEAAAGQTAHLRARTVVDTTAPYELVSRMRASFWVIAPLIARMGEARVSLPGGCAIGTRPVDLLLMALTKLGASIEIDAGYVVARAPKGLVGGEIDFPKVTVGGTHVAMMAASMAHGATLISNAAREPEIVDVADCLNKMGARINGAGTSTNRGRRRPTAQRRASSRAARPDRGGHLRHRRRDDRRRRAAGRRRPGPAPDRVRCPGAGRRERQQRQSRRRVRRNGAGIQAVDVETAPFPGFPTDLQAQFMALMTRARGTSRISETIFENRFMHVQELARLGACIRLDGETAIVEGVERLRGAQVMATDLRASVSLVIAGLAAEGETVVNRVYHLDRGFERLEEKLGACGADITRIVG